MRQGKMEKDKLPNRSEAEGMLVSVVTAERRTSRERWLEQERMMNMITIRD